MGSGINAYSFCTVICFVNKINGRKKERYKRKKGGLGLLYVLYIRPSILHGHTKSHRSATLSSHCRQLLSKNYTPSPPLALASVPQPHRTTSLPPSNSNLISRPLPAQELKLTNSIKTSPPPHQTHQQQDSHRKAPPPPLPPSTPASLARGALPGLPLGASTCSAGRRSSAGTRCRLRAKGGCPWRRKRAAAVGRSSIKVVGNGSRVHCRRWSLIVSAGRAREAALLSRFGLSLCLVACPCRVRSVGSVGLEVVSASLVRRPRRHR